jgi:AmmeMemoRadiSam system protein B
LLSLSSKIPNYYYYYYIYTRAKYWGTWYQGYEGTWYGKDEKDSVALKAQLDEWLKKAKENVAHLDQYNNGLLKAVIVPHAGYSYSGATAAHSYARIDPSLYDRVFVLGPSHYYRMSDCRVTPFEQLETPFGPLSIDVACCESLVSSKLFTYLDKSVDMQEHSLELQFPFLKAVFGNSPVKLVNIMVGVLDTAAKEEYGKQLVPYMKDPRTLFVISSDFCHWGKRFHYQYYDRQDGEIFQSIEKLDRLGMDCIERQNAKEFNAYLEKYQNTICGRNPISVLLEMIGHWNDSPPMNSNNRDKIPLETLFVRYDQSMKCKTFEDLSVSYAAAWTVER